MGHDTTFASDLRLGFEKLRGHDLDDCDFAF